MRKPRIDKKITRSALTRLLRQNGINPAELKGQIASNLYARATFSDVRVTRKDIKRIKRELSEGHVVCLRPIRSHSGHFEFVHPDKVQITQERHFQRLQREREQRVENNGTSAPRSALPGVIATVEA